MLHVIVRALWGVAAGAVVAALVVEGPPVFALETHWLQRMQALVELGAACCALRLARVPLPARVLLAACAAWLALDETLMIHEHLKAPLAFLQPFLGRDPLVTLYGAAGVVALLLLVPRVELTRTSVAFAAIAAACAAGVVLTDSVHVVADAVIGPVIEESCELFAGVATVSFLLVQPGVCSRPSWSLR